MKDLRRARHGQRNSILEGGPARVWSWEDPFPPVISAPPENPLVQVGNPAAGQAHDPKKTAQSFDWTAKTFQDLSLPRVIQLPATVHRPHHSQGRGG